MIVRPCASSPTAHPASSRVSSPSPVHASTYVENVAGQVRPLVRERLPATVLTVWRVRDTVCWLGRLEEKICESRHWLCRGDNCRRGPLRLVGRNAAAVELGLGLCRHETFDGLVPGSPRSRARAPRQELAFCVRDRPGGGGCRCL